MILPWVQLLAAMTAGLGFYLFCRRVLGVGFWSATIPAWCYPMTGFFVFLQSYPTCGAVYWLPWLLLAVTERSGEPPNGDCRFGHGNLSGLDKRQH